MHISLFVNDQLAEPGDYPLAMDVLRAVSEKTSNGERQTTTEKDRLVIRHSTYSYVQRKASHLPEVVKVVEQSGDLPHPSILFCAAVLLFMLLALRQCPASATVDPETNDAIFVPESAAIEATRIGVEI